MKGVFLRFLFLTLKRLFGIQDHSIDRQQPTFPLQHLAGKIHLGKGGPPTGSAAGTQGPYRSGRSGCLRHARTGFFFALKPPIDRTGI
jgi:hypothetical protein